jgi:hypothetical protein
LEKNKVNRLVAALTGTAAGAAALAGILYFYLASSVVSLASSSHNQAASISQNGIFFIIGMGIVQLFWVAPFAGSWGKPWYSAATGSAASTIILWIVLRGSNPLTGMGLGSNAIGIAITILEIILAGLAGTLVGMKTPARKETQIVPSHKEGSAVVSLTEKAKTIEQNEVPTRANTRTDTEA